MARARGFVRGRTHGPGRLTQWIGPADQNFVNVATGATAIIGSISFEGAQTVVRNRGLLYITPQAFSADVTVVGAVGMAVVSTEAFAAGAASIPSPYRDADWGGWLLWQPYAYFLNFGTDVGSREGTRQYTLDSKSMRKITPNETLVLMAESQVGAVSIGMTIRTLIKLS